MADDDSLVRFEACMRELSGQLPQVPWQQILLVHQMRLWLHRLQQDMDALLVPHGLHSLAWYVLITLHAQPELPLGPSDLAGLLHVTRTQATRLLDELEAGKWVRRHASKEDGRRVDLTLTTKGAELVERVMPEGKAFHRRAWSALDAGELRTLSTLMGRLLKGRAAQERQEEKKP